MCRAKRADSVHGGGGGDASAPDGRLLSSPDAEPISRRVIKKIKSRSNMVWSTERARRMRGGSWSQWIGTLCLPMLLVIQPLTDYNLRACLVLMVLAFLVWNQYCNYGGNGGFRRHLKLGGGRAFYRGHERHCDKCDRQLLEQLRAGVRPVVGWNVRSLRRLPLRLLSRHWGKIANAVPPAYVSVICVWAYAKLFSCKLEEAERSELWAYSSLGEFFCRRLKHGARPVCRLSEAVSPADGTVTHAGVFTGGFLQQVKGVHYSINYFLGLLDGGGDKGLHAAAGEASTSSSSLLHHKDGSTALFQWVVYLSPGDYHRFHSPTTWTVTKRRHFPGELLSVKPSVVSSFPGLFHLNERVAWMGEWRHGFFSMTAVGATNVGSIHAEFEPDLRTNQAVALKRECTLASACSKRNFYFNEKVFREGSVLMAKGQDFGHFSFGSTIVLIFEAPSDFQFSTSEGRVQMGQAL